MARAAKRSTTQPQNRFSLGNLLSLIAILALGIVLFYYLYAALISDDWLWFRSSFDAQPRQIAIVDRGQRTELDPSNPAFAPIAAAFNETIQQGYRHAALGFSDETWKVVERNGLLVEMTYAEPVRLHIYGGFAPTKQLRLLLGGKNIHTTQVLFRSNPNGWDSIPLIVNTVEPLKRELSRLGLAEVR
ncbi:MAG TPA: hypothetical protein VFZ66_02870 [Herpetosiphonaceae bacterium]